MLKFAKWKVFLIIVACMFAVYYSLPTLTQNRDFLKYLPQHKLNLGLDLQGGAYILLEVDSDSYINEQLHNLAKGLKDELKSKKFKINNFRTTSPHGFYFEVDEDIEKNLLKNILVNYLGNQVDLNISKNQVQVWLEHSYIQALQNRALTQSIEIIRRRVDEHGTKEIDMQRHGENNIMLQVPGLSDPQEIRNLIGKTAKLSFHIVLGDIESYKAKHKSFIGVKALKLDNVMTNKERNTDIVNGVVVEDKGIITGDMLIDAQVSLNNGTPGVSFKFNHLGSTLFGNITAENIGKPLAIVLDNKIISAPIIKDKILTGTGIISGHFSIQSANELALLLRAGALPAPIKIVEERVIGPSLGFDSIESGKTAAFIGTALVMVFMALFYGYFGLVANIALIFNLFFIVSILSIFGATLTMPGICGIVLTLGMAVDSNILIFERIREEIRKGKTILSSIESGYKFAFITIFDSNITTIAAAIILYIFGTGPIRGFSVTLSVGILSSMFTSIALTKLIVATWYKLKRPKALHL